MRGARLLTVALACACARGEREAREETAAASGALGGTGSAAGNTGAATAAMSAKPACPATGLWSACAIIERLDRAGLAPRIDSSRRADEPPLQSAGTLVTIGRSELELYVYADVAAREADQRRVDRSRYLAPDAPIGMSPQPTLIASANLIAILHSRNDHQRERVFDAIAAGPPQPARP